MHFFLAKTRKKLSLQKAFMALKSSLPNYTFGFFGGVALILGALIPTGIVKGILLIIEKLFAFQLLSFSSLMVLLNTVMWLGAILAYDVFICRNETGKKLNFNFSTTNFYTYFLIFPMMLGMMFISECLTSLIPTTGPVFGEMYKQYEVLLSSLLLDNTTTILLTVIMAPLFEELVFRGIILKGLLNKGWSANYAIWTSALLFGLVHGNLWQFIGAVLLGAVLGLVYQRTKSLLLPILLHAFNNLCAVILLLFTKKESFSNLLGIQSYIILAVGIVLFGLFYFLFTKRYRVHYSE